MTNSETQKQILEDFRKSSSLYGDFVERCETLLKEILAKEAAPIHEIKGRLKSEESLANKIARPDREYERLAQITDLAGVRITTYFAADVDLVAEVLGIEFAIDEANSIDKRVLIEPERFGYSSLHYVVSLRESRLQLREYSSFSGLKIEIQIRSILQHAWAEIEHDLGYKSSSSVPREFRRRFSRIAGLIELADDEFAAIRKGLSSYAETLPQRIAEDPKNVGLDRLSLRAFLSREDSEVAKLTRKIVEIMERSKYRTYVLYAEDAVIDNMVKGLSLLNIGTVATLEATAKSRFDLTICFARSLYGGGGPRHVKTTIGIWLLVLVVAWKRFGEDIDRLDFFSKLKNRAVTSEQMLAYFRPHLESAYANVS